MWLCQEQEIYKRIPHSGGRSFACLITDMEMLHVVYHIHVHGILDKMLKLMHTQVSRMRCSRWIFLRKTTLHGEEADALPKRLMFGANSNEKRKRRRVIPSSEDLNSVTLYMQKYSRTYSIPKLLVLKRLCSRIYAKPDAVLALLKRK